jgi:hypothetical protein
LFSIVGCGQKEAAIDRRRRLLDSGDLVVEFALHLFEADAVEGLDLAAKEIVAKRLRGRNG